MSRSIGDRAFKAAGVSPIPEVSAAVVLLALSSAQVVRFEVEKSTDMFLVLGCDGLYCNRSSSLDMPVLIPGLFDVCREQDIVTLVSEEYRKVHSRSIAKRPTQSEVCFAV